MEPNLLPQEFDGYRLIRQIGAGNMGRVFLGHDTLLDRPVAIKFIATPDPDPESRRRFLVEARAIARLQHPCVVGVYRVGEHQGVPYLVSEFVQGVSLDQIPSPVPWRRVMKIAYDLARGLTVAHKAGVVHRDIKPANAIQAEDGTIKLLDFGIARLTDPLGRPGPAEELQIQVGAEPHPSPVVQSAQPTDDQATMPVNLPEQLPDDATRPVEIDLGNHGMTGSGKAIGTPAFMAPEVWLGGAATCASDVYSLGALLFTLCVGHPPHQGENLEQLRNKVVGLDAEPLAVAVPGVDGVFAAVVDRCLSRDPGRRYKDGNEVRAALATQSTDKGVREIPEGNPFRGLRPFEAGHQSVFFGRDSETAAILDRLNTDPVVVVTGDSGVGKSSLCRAGVLPRMNTWLSGDLDWSIVTVVPGRHPVAAICAALSNKLGISQEPLENALLLGPGLLGREIRMAQNPSQGLVLFVDQLEELVTQASPEEAEIVGALFSWVRDPAPGFRILSSVRGDFLGRLASLPTIGDALSSVLYFLRPLSKERLKEAVLGPVQATGFSFESDETVEALVDSTAGAGGGLPLLQFALQKLWDLRDVGARKIPAHALDTLGGVAGALSVHADEVLSSLDPAARKQARSILLRLVTPEGTRARQTRGELALDLPGAEEALDALIRGRLIFAQESPEGPVYEVAHEALITSWSTLAHWLTDDQDTRALCARIRSATLEWERLGRNRDVLWGGLPLEEARAVDTELLSKAEQAFVAASNRWQRRRQFRLKVAILGVVLALLATYGGVRLSTAIERAIKVDAHMERGSQAFSESISDFEELKELRDRSFSLFDEKRPEEGEVAWQQVRNLENQLRLGLGQASRELENAVALDPERADVTALFSRVLLLRGLEAEARGDTSGSDELISRLVIYDDDGLLMQQWEAPGVVSIVSTPSQAHFELDRLVTRPDGPTVIEPGIASGTTPIRELSLPRGSYRLTLTREGWEPTVHLFQVARGSSLIQEVPMVARGTLPPDFAYVPPGPFLFGSRQDDGLRKGFHHAVPIHEVRLPGYLIARHETTFGEWIRFMESLPEDQRAARAPAVEAGGFQGALSLKKEGSAWRLTFKPASVLLSALSGQSMVFPGREQRASQDWLRFPVVGITAADAEAYAAWLSRQGGVPGARLCSDLEWEKAARGADGREFPHGNVLRPVDANFDVTYSKNPEAMGPDEVGSHPASRSPYGLDDMAGNVWEWVTSSVEPEGHAARGGSFYFDINTARTCNRESPEPSFRDTSVGFRICADLPGVAPAP